MANSLKVTLLCNSGAGDCEPFVLITGLSGWEGFAEIKPAEVANSRSFCDKPVGGLLDGAAKTCGNWLGVMYLQRNSTK